MRTDSESRKKSDPIDAIVDCIDTFVEASYEDSEVTDVELRIAKKRFRSALQYIIITTVEDYFYEKKQIQANTSTQHDS